MKQIWSIPLWIAIVSVSFLFLRWGWQMLQDMGSGIKSWFSDDVEKISRDGWVTTHFMWTGGIMALLALICFIVFLVHCRKSKNCLNVYVEKSNEVREYYNNIVASFEE